MDWGDILYPDNPTRRKTVENKIINIKGYLNSIRTSINYSIIKLVEGFEIIDIEIKIDKIPEYEITDCKKFFEEIDEKMKEINSNLEKYRKHVEMKDPEGYKKVKEVLEKTDLSFKEKLEKIKKDGSIAKYFSAGIISLIVTTYVGTIVKQATQSIVKASLAGGFAGLLIGLAIDVIIGAITGAIERDKLEKAIKELTYAEDIIKKNANNILLVQKDLQIALEFLPWKDNDNYKIISEAA